MTDALRVVAAEALRAGAIAGGLLLAVDLWQVAVREPGSLSVGEVVWLAALYAGVAVPAAAAAAVPATLRRGHAEVTRGPVRAALVCAGAALLAADVALRALPPLSPWRGWAVGAVYAAAAALFVPAARLLRRLSPVAAMAGVAAVASGATVAIVGAGGQPSGVAPPAERADGAMPRGSPTPPNVVLVLIDTLRADHLGCYGYARPTSPRLDAFAREGVLFERAFSQSSWTKPAVASLFTSHYPSTHQTNLETEKLPATETTLAQLLAQRGFATAAFTGNPWITRDYGFDRGFQRFHAVHDERFASVTLFMPALKRLAQLATGQSAWPYNPVKRLVQGDPSTTARDLLVNRAAFAWLDEAPRQPFFLYLHYMSPHHPYDPPPPFDRFVADRARRPVTVYPRKSYFFFTDGEPLSEPDRLDMVARYDGDVAFADGAFGALLDELRRRELLERTLVVVLADHGEEFYDHRNWGHGQSLYNELVHVPLLMRLPGVLPAGVRVGPPAMLVDVVPTVLELVGAPPHAGAAGQSLVAAAGAAPARRPQAYAELLYRYGAARTVVDGGDKLIEMRRGDDGRRELYDLARDFSERRDRAAQEPARADVLARDLDETRRRAELGRAATTPARVGAEQAERLQALGYAGE